MIYSQTQHQLITRANYSSEKSVRVIATSGNALKYNGGTKLYNLWVKLLRDYGYEAFIATMDGQYDKWLINHQPVISYEDVNQLRANGHDVRVLTAWLDTPQLEKIIGNNQFYYFDAELAWTIHFREKLDYFLKKDMIAGIGTHSRYIQSWYMAEYGIKPILINEWSDMAIFNSEPKHRIAGRIGCMVENAKDEEIYQFLLSKSQSSKMCESIIKIKGYEENVSNELHTVDIFVGLNQGKQPLWGEGCPRTQQEAMHCGCVLIAFDVLGNREYLYNGWTGLLVDPGDVDGLWDAIEAILDNASEKERIRTNGVNLVNAVFSEKGKFDLISSFLDLNGMSKDELALIFPKPFWLGREEVPYLSKCANSARSTIVEIGCAYGGSTTIFLLNKCSSAHVFSIDPFVPDSQGGFSANEKECRQSVQKALTKKGNAELYKDWTLINEYSHKAVKEWEREIDLLFIDGNHHYEDVKRDFKQWSRFMAPDGLILLHDSRKDNLNIDPGDAAFSRGWSGPTRLVEELKSTGDFKVVDVCHSITTLSHRGTKKEQEQ